MPKNDVFPNRYGDGYLLDVQTDLLSELNTDLVVPLLPTSSVPKLAKRLSPVFDFEDQPVVKVTQFIRHIAFEAPKASQAKTVFAHHVCSNMPRTCDATGICTDDP